MKTSISNPLSLARKAGVTFGTMMAALLLVSSQSLAATLDLGSSTSRTPYDSYFGPVFAVLGHLSGSQPDPAQVDEWVREGRAFRYSYNQSQPYNPQLPEQTEAIKSGDCKAKSLWLAKKMDTRKVRYVVGKAKRGAAQGHVWLIWQSPEGWLILDATLFSRPLDPTRVSQNEFIPIYSYSAEGKYVHAQAAARAESKDGDHL
jgi:hypothetical protein